MAIILQMPQIEKVDEAEIRRRWNALLEARVAFNEAPTLATAGAVIEAQSRFNAGFLSSPRDFAQAETDLRSRIAAILEGMVERAHA